MGIKHLNAFLWDKSSKLSIRKTRLNHFANKTIVIDTSIYLYKFLQDNALIEHMYLFISILKSNQINPIFVFDGKPPPEKRDLLIARSNEKWNAKQKIIELQKELNNVNNNEKQEILMEIEHLNKKSLRVRGEDIRVVKELMDAYGVNYFDAPAEADQLCIHFVKTGLAWACLSDDMDMFLYGCPYVIRNLSLMNQQVVLYNMKSILKDLNMNETQFREIMVLSGTDYNINSNTSLHETMKWFKEYKKYCWQFYNNVNYDVNSNTKPLTFYVWLVKYTKYVKDYSKLLKTFQLFQLSSYNVELNDWNNIQIPTKSVNMDKLKQILDKEGFVFAD
jgi:5'-3' exonuclease